MQSAALVSVGVFSLMASTSALTKRVACVYISEAARGLEEEEEGGGVHVLSWV